MARTLRCSCREQHLGEKPPYPPATVERRLARCHRSDRVIPSCGPDDTFDVLLAHHHLPPRPMRVSFSSSALTAAPGSACPERTALVVFQNSELTWLYLVPVGVEGRGTALTNVSYNEPKNGTAASTSLSL